LNITTRSILKMTKTSLLAIFAAFSLALSGALVSADEGQQELEPQAGQQQEEVQEASNGTSEEIKSEGEQEEAQNETQSEGNGS
jgi:hypothetical protein